MTLLPITKPHVVVCCFLLFMGSAAPAKELRLPAGADNFYTLSPFPEPQKWAHYFGEYVFPFQATGGTKLHLFPNGQFVISEWSDVGDDSLQAAGIYQVHGKRLTLSFTRVSPENEDLKARFSDLRLLSGNMRQKDFSTDSAAFVFTPEESQKLEKNPEKTRYMMKQTEYHDWERILREYIHPPNE